MICARLPQHIMDNKQNIKKAIVQSVVRKELIRVHSNDPAVELRHIINDNLLDKIGFRYFQGGNVSVWGFIGKREFKLHILKAL